MTITQEHIAAMVKRLRMLGDRASYEPSAHHEAADMLEQLAAERDDLCDQIQEKRPAQITGTKRAAYSLRPTTK